MSEKLVPFDRQALVPFYGIVSSVVLTVQTIQIEEGTTGTARVVAKDAQGFPVEGASAVWGSTSPSVIAVPDATTTDAAGTSIVLLPALEAGATTFSVTVDGVAGTPVVITVAAIDTTPGYDAIGAKRVIINAESTLMRMGRARKRRFSDADQRRRNPSDTSFSRVKDNMEREIVWPNRELLKKQL